MEESDCKWTSKWENKLVLMFESKDGFQCGIETVPLHRQDHRINANPQDGEPDTAHREMSMLLDKVLKVPRLLGVQRDGNSQTGEGKWLRDWKEMSAPC